VTAEPKTKVRDIAALMDKHRISAVPIIDADKRVVGIVSEGDLMRRVSEQDQDVQPRSWWLSLFTSDRLDPKDYIKVHGQFAQGVMTADVIAVEETTGVSEIAAIHERHRNKRVPVTRDERLVGIVSRANLLRGLAGQSAPAPVSPNDRQIREAIEMELGKIVGLNQYFVNVIVTDGVARIWGLVDSAAQMQAVQVAAESTSGVRSVENNLGNIPRWMWAE
jgi:CBS domain-containing protein